MYYSKCDFLYLHLGPILQGNHIFVTLYSKVTKKNNSYWKAEQKLEFPIILIKIRFDVCSQYFHIEN